MNGFKRAWAVVLPFAGAFVAGLLYAFEFSRWSLIALSAVTIALPVAILIATCLYITGWRTLAWLPLSIITGVILYVGFILGSYWIAQSYGFTGDLRLYLGEFLSRGMEVSSTYNPIGRTVQGGEFYGYLLLDLVMIFGVLLFIAYRATRRAYCKERRQYYGAFTALPLGGAGGAHYGNLRLNDAQTFRIAIERGEMETAGKLVITGVKHTSTEVYLTAEVLRGSTTCPVYLSLYRQVEKNQVPQQMFRFTLSHDQWAQLHATAGSPPLDRVDTLREWTLAILGLAGLLTGIGFVASLVVGGFSV